MKASQRHGANGRESERMERGIDETGIIVIGSKKVSKAWSFSGMRMSHGHR